MSINVLFVVIDALRPDVVGCYGYPRNITPNIDKLAKEGVLFEDVYSCSNATDPSITSIFSGKYPQSHGIINHAGRVTQEEIVNFNNSGTILLSEILSQRGYATFAVDWLDRWHKRGFDFYFRDYEKTRTRKIRAFIRHNFPYLAKTYSKIKKLRKPERKVPHEDASEVTDVAIKLIEENFRKDFFLFIHYWDTHTPYSSPEKFANKLQKGIHSGLSLEELLRKIPKNSKFREVFSDLMGDAMSADDVIARYLGAVNFVDSQIGRLTDSLHSLGIFDKTMIIITSDHGESLTEHEIYFDHHGLYDVSLHVPLICHFPHFSSKTPKIRGLIQNVDILPTILDILEINREPFHCDGRSFLPLMLGKKRRIRSSIYAEESFTERKMAVRTENYKYIEAFSEENAVCRYCNVIHGGVRELYDLNRNPEETHNLVQEQLNLRRKLQKILDNWNHYFQTSLEKTRIGVKIEKLKKAKRI
ncbi:MAG: hypothetical protein E3J56_15350 [Candidatus Aminicenantes bacterium]|nr:MAG: hypothetical protein E3J56_15350 [Candidatus Aminicenantes bacterium]